MKAAPKFNWPFLIFWVGYIGLMLAITSAAIQNFYVSPTAIASFIQAKVDRVTDHINKS
jgi:hypothetical protein